MTRRSIASLVVMLLVTTTSSGCIDELFGDDPGPKGDLSRHLEIDLTEDTVAGLEDAETPEEAYAAVGAASYKYVHQELALKPANAIVHFVDENGDAQEKPLSTFTNLEELQQGSAVTIDGLHPLSPLKIVKGSSLVAARGGLEADWFTVGGAPMPLSGDPGASVEWALDTGVSLSAMMDSLTGTARDSYEQYECVDEPDDGDPLTTEGETCSDVTYETEVMFDIEDTTMTLAFDLDGTYAMAVEELATGSKLTHDVDVTGSMTGAFSTHANITATDTASPDEPVYQDFDAGVRASMSLALDANVAFTADETRELLTATTSGSTTVDGSVEYWNDTIPEQRPAEATDLGLPFSESWGPESDDADAEPAPQEVIDNLTALWSMDLAVGDSMDITASVDSTDGSGELSYQVLVVKEGEYMLNGVALPTLDLQMDFSFSVDVEGIAEEFSLGQMAYQLHQESYLPLSASSSWTFDLDVDLFRDVADLILESSGEDLTWTMNPDPSSTLTASYALNATAYEGTWQGSALLTASGMFTTPLGLIMITIPGLAMEGFDDDSWEVESAPSMAFNKNAAESSLTVVMTDANLYWGEFDVSGCNSLSPGQQVTAGDVLTDCAGSVTIVHYATNTIIYSTSF